MAFSQLFAALMQSLLPLILQLLVSALTGETV
jgi:hypothetical protein